MTTLSTSETKFDLTRHAIVEASAGTGKTYTLLQLVRRLFLESNVTIDQILLVTYTEKATGEIKARLQRMLADESATQPKLGEALRQIDQASVFTIHGFCQRILQEFAFENREDFQPTLVDDPEQLKVCLRELQRKHWPKEYGHDLPFLLNLAGYAGRDGVKWEQQVLELANRLRPECGHRLAPEPMDGFVDQLSAIREACGATLKQVRDLADPLRGESFDDHGWLTGYMQLPHRKDHLTTRFNDRLRPLLEWILSPSSEENPLLGFYRLLGRFDDWKLFQDHGFAALTDKLDSKSQPKLPKHCPQLQDAMTLLDGLRMKFDWSRLGNQLAVHTVRELQKLLDQWKRERGRQSFQDMLVRMDEGLDPARNPGAEQLVHALRAKYRFAIVDEFQDTDQLQWRIFRRIFVDGKETRLFVVGDPKQAIYGFRGADVVAYENAKKTLRSSHGAELAHLDVNWRACDHLVHALNQLFKKGEWFEPPITYYDVKPAPLDERPYRMTADHTGRAAVTAVNHGNETTAKKVLRRHAQFIADEIARLRDLGPALILEEKGEEARPLHMGDISILVRKRSEADPVIEALNRHDIPYTFYKQGGLWQSEEAAQLRCLLHALVDPKDESAFRMALLTKFFGLSPMDLAQADEIPHNHPARELFSRWFDHVAKNRWSAFFLSLRDDTELLHADDINADRRLANLRQLTASLEQAAYEEKLDAWGLLQILENRRRFPPREDADVQPIESDAPKVKFLTIHASKGLEFPIVFLAGGYTADGSEDVYQYHVGDDLMFHLPPSVEGKQASKAENDDEHRRLFYVALTRAIFKLYVPFAPKTKRSGPVTTLLGKALNALNDIPSPPEGQWQFIDADVGPIRDVSGVSPPHPPIIEPIELPATLFPRINDKLKDRRRTIYSFSKLHYQLAGHDTKETVFEDQEIRADDDRPDSLSPADQLRGPVFGDMVHNLLEWADFDEVGQAATASELLRESSAFRRLIDEQISKHAAKLRSSLSRDEMEALCRQEMAKLVWMTLRTPLSQLGRSLSEIPIADRLHEVEFLAHHKNTSFLTGYIDVVLRHQGRYFIVDYKTNLLPSYDEPTIYKSMLENDYTLQFKIYLQALAKWLMKVTGNPDSQRDIGGVFYLYVRGLNGEDDSSGVYFHRPTPDDLNVEMILGGNQK